MRIFGDQIMTKYKEKKSLIPNLVLQNKNFQENQGKIILIDINP
jgi:hypothetical protein